MTKVAMFGAGGVGGYFGARLAASGVDVHLVARGAHLDALRARGLDVHSARGDFRGSVPATDDPSTIGECDVVFVTVKSPETDHAAEALDPLVGPSTVVISLQNGVDNEAQLTRALRRGVVMGGVAFIMATIREPGVIEHVGELARIVFGELDRRPTERGAALLDLLDKAGIDAEHSTNIHLNLWDKFAYICAHAGMTAVTRKPIGELRGVPESWEMFRALSQEVCDVGRAEGVPLPADTTARHLAFAQQLHPAMRSSLHYDLVHGKPMELDALHGSVVRRAATVGVSVPMNTAVYALLRPWTQ